MKKRGQFYILIAIVLSIAIFALSTKFNEITITKPSVDFTTLSNNYIQESQELINYVILQKEEPIIRLNLFTTDFLSFARTKNPKMGLVYVYSEGDDIASRTVIENHLESGIVTYDSGVGPNPLFNSNEKAINQITLEIAGEEFSHDVPTKLSDFSDNYYSAPIDSEVKNLKLDIAGTSLFFDLPPLTSFNVHLRTTNEEFGTQDLTTFTCTVTGGVASCP